MSIGQLSSKNHSFFQLEGIKAKPSQKLLMTAEKNIDPNQKDQYFPKEMLEEVVKSMNEFLQPSQTSLKFQMHEKLQEYYVSIVDDVTKEVVREIPSKKLLDMYAEMSEFLGLVVDKKI